METGCEFMGNVLVDCECLRMCMCFMYGGYVQCVSCSAVDRVEYISFAHRFHQQKKTFMQPAHISHALCECMLEQFLCVDAGHIDIGRRRRFFTYIWKVPFNGRNVHIEQIAYRLMILDTYTKYDLLRPAENFIVDCIRRCNVVGNICQCYPD